LKHQETTNISNSGNSYDNIPSEHQQNGKSPLCLRKRLPSQPTNRVFGETPGHPSSASDSGGEIDDMVEADEGATSTPLTSLVASQKAGLSLTSSKTDHKTPNASFQAKRSDALSQAQAKAAKMLETLPNYRRNRKRGRPPESGGKTCPKCSQSVTMQYAGFLNHIRNCLTEDKKYFDGWPWKCQLCISEGRPKESLFLSESAVKTHMRMIHQGLPPESGGKTCPKCSQSVTMQYAGFLNHIRNCLTEDKKYFDGWPWKCQLCISEGRPKESLFLSESAVKTHMSVAWNHKKVDRESRSEEIVKGLSKRIKTEQTVEESPQNSEYSSVDNFQPLDESNDHQEESYVNEQACGKSMDPNQQLVQNFLSNSLWNS